MKTLIVAIIIILAILALLGLGMILLIAWIVDRRINCKSVAPVRRAHKPCRMTGTNIFDPDYIRKQEETEKQSHEV